MVYSAKPFIFVTSKPKQMKKIIIIVLAVSFLFTSCATVLGGKVQSSQKRKPMPGEPQRSIRAGYLIADLLLCAPCLIVDFATGAIYKPAPETPAKP